MRKSLAAACAAALVGLAQPGALCVDAYAQLLGRTCASLCGDSLWRGARESSPAGSLAQRSARARAAAVSSWLAAAPAVTALSAVNLPSAVRTSPRVFCAPSGPAPSQAPPALA